MDKQINDIFLKRKVDKYLKDWKSNLNRKLLIISGARQVGKTKSVEEFGKLHESFKNYRLLIIKIKIIDLFKC